MSAKSRTGLWLNLGLVVAILAGAIAAGYYYSRPVAVVAPVVKGRAVNAVPGSVTVFAEYQMELKSEIGGRIIRSVLEPGLPVKEGEVLAQIDPGDLDLEIERLQSEYEAHKRRLAVGSSLKLSLATAREEAQNAERLHKLGSLSDSELTRQQRGLKQVEQQVELEAVENQLKTDNYENAIKTKRRQREKMTIVAPFDGVVSNVAARPGDIIGGNNPIATLISINRTVEAKISEENFASLKEGQTASVRFLGYGDVQYRATIDKILPTADPVTQRYIIYLKVDLPLDKLVPGLTGEASIVVGQREAEAIIPRRALRGNEVFVVSAGKVELRKVQPGYVLWNQAEIVGGLKAGEQVIAEELDLFRPGMLVRTNRIKE
jgi:RND family efflux transporter MFP subunit